jgi:hypothetical protein
VSLAGVPAGTTTPQRIIELFVINCLFHLCQSKRDICRRARNDPMYVANWLWQNSLRQIT